jgi:hypothetical protein
MRGRALLVGGGLWLAACTATPERPDGGALAAIGTPVYALFKGVACVATVAVAAPGASALALTDRRDKATLTRELERGVAANCGGRWTLGEG